MRGFRSHFTRLMSSVLRNRRHRNSRCKPDRWFGSSKSSRTVSVTDSSAPAYSFISADATSRREGGATPPTPAGAALPAAHAT